MNGVHKLKNVNPVGQAGSQGAKPHDEIMQVGSTVVSRKHRHVDVLDLFKQEPRPFRVTFLRPAQPPSRANLAVKFEAGPMGLATEVTDTGAVLKTSSCFLIIPCFGSWLGIRVKNILYGSQAYLKDVEIGDVLTGLNGVPLAKYHQGPGEEELTAQLVERIIADQPRPVTMNFNGLGPAPAPITYNTPEPAPSPAPATSPAPAPATAPPPAQSPSSVPVRASVSATPPSAPASTVETPTNSSTNEDADIRAFKELIVQGIELQIVTESSGIFQSKPNADHILFMDEGFQKLYCGESRDSNSAKNSFTLDQLHAIR
jgi:hypothetical protein